MKRLLSRTASARAAAPHDVPVALATFPSFTRFLAEPDGLAWIRAAHPARKGTAPQPPSFRVGMTVSECTHNPLGVKGCGEAGAIAAPAALMNAITDALGQEIDMPASPEKVWRACQARMAQAAE